MSWLMLNEAWKMLNNPVWDVGCLDDVWLMLCNHTRTMLTMLNDVERC